MLEAAEIVGDGLLAIGEWAQENREEAAVAAVSQIPVYGDIVGAIADAKAFHDDPSWQTALLGIAGLVPGIPGGLAGAIKSVTRADNLKAGRNAMRRVLETGESVPDAMWRDDVGSITFDYGLPGNPKNKFKGGWGASHIVSKRTQYDGIDGDWFVKERIPEILADGRLQRILGGPNRRKATIVDRNDAVHLGLYYDKKRKTWLVTGYEIRRPGEPGAGP